MILRKDLSNYVLGSSVSPQEAEIFKKETQFPGDDAPHSAAQQV